MRSSVQGHCSSTVCRTVLVVPLGPALKAPLLIGTSRPLGSFVPPTPQRSSRDSYQPLEDHTTKVKTFWSLLTLHLPPLLHLSPSYLIPSPF